MNFLRAIGNLLRFDRANWKAVFLCFIVAIIFWLFNAFNKTYSTNVRFPLRFEYDADHFVPTVEMPRQIMVNVSGNGWDLFRSYFGIKLPELAIALERPLETRKIIGTSLLPQLEPQIGKLKINYVVTDTLHLKLDERDSHLFKIAVDARNIRFKSGLGRISPIVILPDSITLDGSKNLLHQLADSLLLHLEETELDDNYAEEVEVSLPDPIRVTRNPPTVKVMFEVGPILEKEFFIKWNKPSTRAGISDSIRMKVIIPAKHEQNFLSIQKQLVATGTRLKNSKEFPAFIPLPTYVSGIEIDSIAVK
jgi:hypothetical protein